MEFRAAIVSRVDQQGGGRVFSAPAAGSGRGVRLGYADL